MSDQSSRLFIAALVALGLSGCYDRQEAATFCADHGGIKAQNTSSEGLFGEDTDATVICNDGSAITFEGWNVSKHPAKRASK